MLGPALLPSAETIIPPSRWKAFFCVGALLAGALCLAAPALSQGGQPATGATVVYQVELEAGSNLVSLPIVPSNPVVTDIMAGALPQVTLVQSETGRYLIPSQGIDELDPWAWDEAYKVEVTAPTTLAVEGARILPRFSPIALEPSTVNWVAYPRQEAMAVEEALASIAPFLDRVEAADRRFFVPGDAASTLDSLRTGQGYKVWVNQAVTFTYPADSAPPNNGSAANTISEALTLTGLTPGQQIEVLGYYAPGDGGGGTFLVTDGGEAPDGGLVFVPYEAQGVPIITSGPGDTNGYISFSANAPVAFGSFSYTLSKNDAGGNPWSLTLTDLDMHGATSVANLPEEVPFFYHGAGLMDLQSFSPVNTLLAHTGARAHTATVAYRPVTGSLRLVRDTTGANGVWDARWFGCRADDEAAYFNNSNCLNWAGHAIRGANAGAATPADSVRALLLSDNDDDGAQETFYYMGSVVMAEDTELWGERGAVKVDSTDAHGNDFSFVRARSDAVVLKLLPESAPGCTDCREVLASERMLARPYTDAGHLPPTPDVFVGNGKSAVTFYEGSRRNGIRRLVLDGNYENQLAIYASPYTFTNREDYLRNSPAYTGYNGGNHGSKAVGDHRTTLEDVVITGYSATGGLFYGNAAPTVMDRVAFGNAGWNHAIYAESRVDARDLTLFGFSWGFVMGTGSVENLVVLDAARSPYRGGAAASIQWRGPNVWNCTDPEAIAANSRALGCGVSVNGYYFDFAGIETAWSGIGPAWDLLNGTVVGPAYTPAYWESHNGYNHARYDSVWVNGLDLYFGGGDTGGFLIGEGALNRSFFRDIEARADPNGPAGAGEGVDYGSLLNLTGRADEGVSGEVYEVVLDSIGVTDPVDVTFIYSLASNPADYTVRYFFREVHLDQDDDYDNQPVRQNSTITNQEFYWRDSSFDMGTTRWDQYESFFSTHRFDGVTDNVSGNTSEATGTYTCQAGDGTTPRFRLDGLMWLPHADRGVVEITGGTFGGSLVSWVSDKDGAGTEYDDDDNRRQPYVRITLSEACVTGETIEWGAAVSEWLDDEGDPVAMPGWYPY